MKPTLTARPDRGNSPQLAWHEDNGWGWALFPGEKRVAPLGDLLQLGIFARLGHRTGADILVSQLEYEKASAMPPAHPYLGGHL